METTAFRAAGFEDDASAQHVACCSVGAQFMVAIPLLFSDADLIMGLSQGLGRDLVRARNPAESWAISLIFQESLPCIHRGPVTVVGWISLVLPQAGAELRGRYRPAPWKALETETQELLPA